MFFFLPLPEVSIVGKIISKVKKEFVVFTLHVSPLSIVLYINVNKFSPHIFGLFHFPALPHTHTLERRRCRISIYSFLIVTLCSTRRLLWRKKNYREKRNEKKFPFSLHSDVVSFYLSPVFESVFFSRATSIIDTLITITMMIIKNWTFRRLYRRFAWFQSSPSSWKWHLFQVCVERSLRLFLFQTRRL